VSRPTGLASPSMHRTTARRIRTAVASARWRMLPAHQTRPLLARSSHRGRESSLQRWIWPPQVWIRSVIIIRGGLVADPLDRHRWRWFQVWPCLILVLVSPEGRRCSLRPPLGPVREAAHKGRRPCLLDLGMWTEDTGR